LALEGKTTQIQIFGERCRLCREYYEGAQEAHLDEDCIVTHTHSWVKGDWAQESFSEEITRLLNSDDYFGRRKARFIHKRTPRSHHGYDDYIVDLENMEAVASDTKNYIMKPFDSTYMKEGYLAKETLAILDLRTSKKHAVKIIARSLVVFGGVENSCHALCRKEGVKLIHELDHCLPYRSTEAVKRAARTLVEYAKMLFKREDNVRAFDRLWQKAHEGKRLEFINRRIGSGEHTALSPSEEYDMQSQQNKQARAIQREAQDIYEGLVHIDSRKVRLCRDEYGFFYDVALQCFLSFCDHRIVRSVHRLAGADSFCIISSDLSYVSMDIRLYRAFVGYAAGGMVSLE
jgi:hypothetical protein